MSNVLFVPVHLDALFLTRDTFVAEAMADFTRLPYFNGQRDVNPDVANISEDIVIQPFQDKNFNLKAGLHLHWALPDALTKTVGIRTVEKQIFQNAFGSHGNRIWDQLIQKEWIKEIGDSSKASVMPRGKRMGNLDGFEEQQEAIEAILTQPLESAFSPVPNRWLVERKGGGLLTKKWVVESDYLYPYGEGRDAGSVNILYSAELFSGGNVEEIVKLANNLKKSTSPYDWIKDQFSGYTITLLDDYDLETPSEKLQAALMWELNQILQGASIYDETRFSGIVLSQETQNLLDSQPQGENLVHLNRLLLEAACPECQSLGHQPFRYMGRTMPFEDWLNQTDDPCQEYLNPLTAVGYGEPTFAAFYPNCYSVFGFYDGDIQSPPNSDLKYTVVGWYDRQESNYFRTFVQHTRNLYQGENGQPSNAELLEAMEEEFKWTTEIASQEFPEEMLCYARILFESETTSIENSQKNSDTQIAVGSTSTEALSAFLGNEIDSAHKSTIEDQLECLHLFADLEHRKLDIGPKFKEARHEKEFNSANTGTLWTIRQEATSDKADAEASDARERVVLPDDIADALNTLNLKQKEYEGALEEIESLQEQIFADWYKYMLCAYPPDDSRDDYPNIDEVKHYIEVKGLAPLEEKLERTGKLGLLVEPTSQNLMVRRDSNDGSVITATAERGSIAWELASVINELLDRLDSYNQELQENDETKTLNIKYVLKRISSPHYWQPNNPAILIEGEAAKFTERHGSDGGSRDVLECQLYDKGSNSIRDLIDNYESTIGGEIDAIASRLSNNSIAFSTWKQQPWNPFLLEWEVEVLPVEQQGNHGNSRAYDPGFIVNNYELNENATDLSVQSQASCTTGANIYSGISIVTPYASHKLGEEIEAYLKQRNTLGEQSVMEQYFEANGGETDRDDYLRQPGNIQKVKTWYNQEYIDGKSPEEQAQDPIYTAIRAYEKLQESHIFAQALGGFNSGLLMHKQTMQLEIDDPIGFEDYKSFTKRVRQAVGDRFFVAPLPLNDFNPIRSGLMKVLRLRLIDTFGQVKADLNPEELIRTEKMIPPNSFTESLTYYNGDWAFLPPRLVQPSRLNFRWLSSSQGEEESNSHPKTTPICGWLLPNNLDNSLMVYDSQGKALGSVNSQANWEPAPGSNIQFRVVDIVNSYLRKIVDRLTIEPTDTDDVKNRKRDFLDHLITVIDRTLEDIDPENATQHQDLALLMGRPVAVVRASLNLELQGLPAIHQGWNEFRQDLRRDQRDTDNFTQVEFPIRIGEYQQLNDGTIGYWQEEDGSLSEDFYVPHNYGVPDDKIKTEHLIQTIDEPPKTLTLLMDPTGKVHATCGIVPTKAIDIPPALYKKALQNIEITFLSVPILTEAYKINLPLSKEAGYAWSWLEKDRYTWKEISTVGVLRKEVILAEFDDGEGVWQHLIEQGWIEEEGMDPGQGRVVPKDQREDLEDDMQDKQPKIEDILERSHIGQVSLKATFSDANVLHEGWLALKKV